MSLSDNVQKAVQELNSGKNLLIDGATGSGKTFLIIQLKLIMKDYVFIDVLNETQPDSPNFFSDIASASSKSKSNHILVIDPFDNVSYADWMKFQRILEVSNSQFIVVLSDSWKIPPKAAEKFVKISCKSNLRTIKSDLNVTKASNDYRSTILASTVGSELLDSDGIFDRVREIFEGTNINLREDEVAWLFDNASSLYNGRELLNALKAIELFAAEVPALNCLKPTTPRFGQIMYPSFYRSRRLKYDVDDDESE